MTEYEPWMKSILNRMKELYNKPNAKSIAEALPEVSGEGGSAEVTPESLVSVVNRLDDNQADRVRSDIGAVSTGAFKRAIDALAPLKLTATPTAGPSGTDLMYGTWSGATWEEVVAAILASRLIQVDVATIGEVTLLYNLGSSTSASSNAFVYNVGGTLYNVFVELFFINGNNVFYLTIINARAKTQNVSGTTPTITPAANNIYKCGELTSLTITNPPATGAYSIAFVSGATATDLAVPPSIVMPDGFSVAANTRYEINVLDGYAVVGSWTVSA